MELGSIGKPLYRKSILFPNGNNGTTSAVNYSLADYGITNVDIIYLATPSFYTSDNSTRSFPFNFYDGNRFEAAVTRTNFTVTLGYSAIASSLFVLTFEYTKTTD